MEFNKAYSRTEFLSFLRTGFLPEDFQQEEVAIQPSTQTTYTQQVTKLGVCHSLDLIVYEIKHNGKEDPRVGLSKEAFRMLADEWQSRALVIFVPQSSNANYRFSLIEIKLEGDRETSKVHRRYSNPRRYSYLLGEGVGGYTPNKYLAKGKIKDDKDLRDRFSVEVLTKAFYNELSDWYAWAIDSVTFPGEQNEETEEKRIEHRSKNVIRLLTRLLFVWFLKQKNLIPWELFDERYLNKNLLTDFYPNLQTDLFEAKNRESKYYKAILQNLFFATLNCPIVPQSKEDSRERAFRKKDWYGQGFGQDHLMRYEDLFINPQHFIELVNEKVPFLNGGLFDCLDDKENKVFIDGFSDNLTKPNQLIVPDFVFFGEVQGKGKNLSEFYGDKKKKNSDVLGLVDILQKYNFTIEENTPFDQEVSLDPELLGKVFENLLASYNPETKTTARKQTGSFYTPREIVQYMVDESLIAHLKRTVGEEYEEEYRKLMRYTDEEFQLSNDKQKEIIQSIQNCKVLDPACGSGAFPVGVLQQMVHILSQLDPSNEYWNVLVKSNTKKELVDTLEEENDEERDEILSDINRVFSDSKERPDYARKLYLIENCIYGVDIQSIAVQISKLRFFISLVVDQKPNTDAKDNFGIRPLPNLEAKFVAANTLIGLEKRNATLFDSKEIEKLQDKLVQASHRIFGAKSNKIKNKYRARVEELQGKIAEKLEEMGAVGNDDARLMRQWRMFDQNASSPFFNSWWMFGVKDGFDIVIGNPPYIQLQANKGYLSKLYANKGYSTFFKSGDIYCLFYEKAYNLLTNNGVLSYITPNTWLQSISFSPFRNFISSKFSWSQILINQKVFDATVDTHCIIFTKANLLRDCEVFKQTIDGFIYSHSIENCFISKDGNIINIQSNKQESVLFKKITEKSEPLKNFLTVYNGVKPFEKGKGNPPQTEETMINKPFVFEGNKPDESWLPLMRGSLMNRYANLWNNDYWILYGGWLAAPRDPQIFSALEKIIVRQTGDSIIATTLGKNIICRNNLHICISNGNVSIKSILGILNSKLIDFAYSFINPEKGEALAEVKKSHVESLPIKIGNEDEVNDIENVVTQILESKKSNLSTDTSELEAQINKLVYELYGLTEEEIKFVEGRV